ncbi:hypothetical protein JKA74_00320 [Marivirga sp. S37H4]|uniref:Calx-beta domain-containing protein n=1 Tax=Marivirga aurantiaca TaxID=2802615 RepID=A0A934WV12_9BACT|nr:Calx-beta domain-containing protein [Marivirga aurantiaca]MBK6263460.1 hypothetical protein [Marivirga aurantiaca]
MKNYKSFFKITFSLLAAIIFVACEGEEESISLTPGSGLMISGPDDILTYSSNRYFVRGHDINEEYTWSISGDGVATVTEEEGRSGEYVRVFVEDEGSYTLTVENNEGLVGSYEINVRDVDEFIGVGQDTLYISEEEYQAGSDTLLVPVTISERNIDSTAIEFEIIDGTAVQGIDYEVLNTDNVLRFSPGQTEAYVRILTNDNMTIDGVRDFRIVLGEILTTGEKSSAVEHAPDSLEIGQSVIYIQDDTKTVNLSVEFEEVEVNEAGNYFIEVALNRAVSEDVTIEYTIDGLPLLSDADKTDGSVTIYAGNTSEEIVLDIDPDWLEEGEEPTVLEIQLEEVISNDEEVTLGSVTEFTIVAGPAE